MSFGVGLILASLAGLVVLGATAIVLYWSALYRRSPEKRWRDRVLQALQTAQRLAASEHARMRRAGLPHDAEDAAVREQAFRSFLQGISVNELEAYPGIGPGTTTRLREAGYADLASLQAARVGAAGLGQKRLADIKHAVRNLTRQARSRFDAGACPEARELAGRLQALQAARTEEGACAAARHKAAVQVGAQLQPLADLARHIRFTGFMRGQTHLAVARPLLHTPLPDLEQAVRQAEEQARQSFRQKPPSAPAVEPAPAAPRTTTPRAASAPSATPAFPTATPAAPPVDLFRDLLHRPTAPPEAIPVAPAAPPPPARPVEDAGLARLRAALAFAWAAARADGRVSRKERSVIEEYLRQTCGADRALLNRAQALSAQYESAAVDVDDCLARVAGQFPAGERQALLDLAVRIADAAGERNPKEEAFLDRAARALGLGPAPPAAVPAPEPPPASPPPPEDRRIALEIDPAVPLTADLVRRQWNLLAERYAPAKFASAGPEFVAVAERKRAAARAAASALLAELGESLEVAPAPAAQELRHNPDLDAIFGG
jgi:uncharacterized tellurite resistance protein B-like protein